MSGLCARGAGWGSLNPILVKEMRQAVRSRMIMAAVLLFPIALFIISGMMLITANVNAMMGSDIQLSKGRDLFQMYFGVLCFGSMLCVPLYTGIRLAQELSGGQMDLLFITTIGPGAIVRGKLTTGLAVAVQLFSLCMPFMAFTYLLRGIDLFTVFFLLLALFLFIAVATALAILIACLPQVHAGFKNLLLVGGALFCAFFTTIYFESSFSIGRGLSGQLMTWSFWAETLTIGAGLLLGAILVLSLAAAVLSPPASNRALMVRLLVTTAWLLGSLLSTIWAVSGHDAAGMIGWGWLSTLWLGGALLAVISESEQVSVRVQLTIPKRWWARVLAFLFYNGSGGGLLWCLSLLALTLGLVAGAWWLYGMPTTEKGVVQGLQILAQYIVLIGLLALFLRRAVLKRWLPAHFTWAVAVALWALLGTVPICLGFALADTWHIEAFFAFDKPATRFWHVVVSGGLAAIGLIACVPWIIRQFRRFKRPGEGGGLAPVSQTVSENV